MIHKNCLIGWLDNQIEQSEKENNVEMVKAYRNVLNLIRDSDALNDIEYLEYFDKKGIVQIVKGVKVTLLNKYKIRIRELEE